MKPTQPAHTLLKPIVNKLATPSPISTTQTGEQASEPTPQEQQTRVLVNMLFARFKAIYTHKFASAYSSMDEVKLAKREWAIAIKGYQESILAHALERAKETYAWPPTIAEFLQLINTAYKAYGLPDPRSAYLEACRCRSNPLTFKWSHPAVYLAGSQAGWYLLRSEEEYKSWPAFEKTYLALAAQVMAGERLHVPQVAQLESKPVDSLAVLIPEFSKMTGLTESQVATLLYYMKKTSGTEIRRRYRAVAQQKLAELGVTAVLPD